MSGRTDAVEEAKRMELLLAAEVPQGWDMMLIGVGLDGHVGSVYPHSGAVADTRSGVLSVMKPTSSSISLTLPTMLAAKQIVIATAGKSDKYPLGKAEGMFRALEKDDETIESFPAVAFRQSAKWLLDEGAASLLKSL